MDYVSNVVGDLKIDDINIRLSYMELIYLTPDDFKASHRLRNALRNKEIIAYDPQQHKSVKRNVTFNNSKQLRNPEIFTNKKVNLDTPNFSEITELKEVLGSISKKMEILVERVDKILIQNDHCVQCLEKSIESTQKQYQDRLDTLNQLLEKNIENNQRNFETTRQSYDSKIDKLNLILDTNLRNSETVRQNYDMKIDNLNKVLEKAIEQNTIFEEKFKEYLEKETKISVLYQNPTLDILITKLDTLISSGIKVQGSNVFNTSKTESSSRMKEDIPIFVPDINSEDIKVNVVTKEEKSEGTDSILEKLKKLKK